MQLMFYCMYCNTVCSIIDFAFVAQGIERQFPALKVTGSNPVKGAHLLLLLFY